MRAVVVGLVLLAACACGGSGGDGGGGPLRLPAGYSELGTEEGEPAAFRRLYRETTGASSVEVHRVDTPPDAGPPLVVVRLRWPSEVEATEVAEAVARDVPIGGGRPDTVAGHPAVVHEADATFRSVVLVIDGRRAVLVYGGVVADERKVARAAIGG